MFCVEVYWLLITLVLFIVVMSIALPPATAAPERFPCTLSESRFSVAVWLLRLT